ncbi:SRPBCC domain-containing protein [Streptomyces canus]|uniref:SRPBCC family protein n=1 Tax=Streptomyces canus TaxID=58343 RepID=UPI0036B44956
MRVDQVFPHPPAKVWRALTEPRLLVQWQMQGAEAFRLEVLAFEPQRMPSLRWTDADPANSADWTVTWKVEQEGRGTRLFLVHEGFDPDDPAQLMARSIMDGGWRTHVMRALGHTMERI